jgi:Fe-S-cluster containining protein
LRKELSCQEIAHKIDVFLDSDRTPIPDNHVDPLDWCLLQQQSTDSLKKNHTSPSKKTHTGTPIISSTLFAVIPVSLTPIPFRVAALTQERNSLFEYPLERLAKIIQEIGFRCTECSKCCTREFNGHVFLLDHDVKTIRKIDPSAIEPAPSPEFCDQNGIFYVSGYALRTKTDEHGTCWFLENGRCRIYDNRPVICRVYPSMLHRESDENGIVDWRQFSGLDKHGEYHVYLSEEESVNIARETKEYENAFLTQEIQFLEYMQDYFARRQLRHVQKIYDDRMRGFLKGDVISVMVYYDSRLEKHSLRRQ